MALGYGKKTGLDADGMTLRQMWWGTPALYSAPLFQRRFVWSSRQFDQLWEDVDDVLDGVVSNRFLGAIVLRDISTRLPGYPSEYLIIDGQQRLTSLFILLVAVADLAHGIAGGSALAEEIAAYSLVNSVPQARGYPKVAPTLHDRAQFHAIASRLGSITTVMPALAYGPATGPMQAMYDKCRSHVRRELLAVRRESEGSGDKEQVEYLQRLYSVVMESLKFVGILLGDDDDPHQVFDRLNSGGIKLKVSDLVRNDVFRRLADKPKEAESLSTGLWADLEQSLSGRFEDFIFTYGLIKKPTTTKGTLLEDLHGTWGVTPSEGGLTAREIIDDMAAYVPAFLAVAGPPVQSMAMPVSELPESLLRRCRRLREMPIPTSVYPYATMLVHEASRGQVSPGDSEHCLGIVESFLVRRAFAGFEPTGLHAVFKAMWQEAGSDPEALVREIDRRKTVRFPTDEEFQSDIRARPVYRMRLLPFVMAVYESSLPGDPVPQGLMPTIDHVMPQHPDASWQIDKDDHTRLVDTWANLIPLSGPGNSAKGNHGWPAVRDRLRVESAWKTSRRLAESNDTWTIEDVRNRAQRLGMFAVREWPRG